MIILVSMIILACFLFSACENTSREPANKFIYQEHFSRDFRNIDRLSIVGQVANISIKPSKNNILKCRIEKSIVSKAENTKGLIKDIKVLRYSRNRNFIIDVVWDRQGSLKDSDIEVNLELELPDNVLKLAIETQISRIDMRDLEVSLELKSNIAYMNIESLIVTGDSLIEFNIGNLYLDIRDFKNTDYLDISTELGDLSVNIPRSGEGLEEIKLYTDRGSLDYYLEKDLNILTISRPNHRQMAKIKRD